jgi:tRNA U34 5-methylaminomethyl-2-thiouridine-forming methyltransferase MnmC
VPEPTLIETADGSHSLFVPELNEHYHSVHGALQESRHVFIEAGLKQISKNNIRILEVGLGTGLNALLTMVYASENGKHIDYTAVEAFPLSTKIIQSLNYVEQIGEKEFAAPFFQLHTCPSGSTQKITGHFTICRIDSKLEEALIPQGNDLIYFDAFAPTVQPELWSESVFKKLFESMLPGAILVTYCAKGAVRRAMNAAGFKTERIPGPPGKREMIRAKREY